MKKETIKNAKAKLAKVRRQVSGTKTHLRCLLREVERLETARTRNAALARERQCAYWREGFLMGVQQVCDQLKESFVCKFNAMQIEIPRLFGDDLPTQQGKTP